MIQWLRKLLGKAPPAKPLDQHIWDKYLNHPMTRRSTEFEARIDHWKYYTGITKVRDLERFAQAIQDFGL